MDDEVIQEKLGRITDENDRQNRRIELLEKSVENVHSIAISVERLATNMEMMLAEQKKQGERLDKLEAEPASRWNAMTRTIFNTILGAIIGAIATGIFYAMTMAH